MDIVYALQQGEKSRNTSFIFVKKGFVFSVGRFNSQKTSKETHAIRTVIVSNETHKQLFQ
jgi:hypothetical protein